MHEKMIRQFNSDVAEALSARRAAGLTSRKAALALLKAPGWTETLEGLLPIRQRLTCAQALELCRQLPDFFSPAPEQGWLAFCYDYVRTRMFPDGCFVPIPSPYAAGAEVFLAVLQVLLDHERAALPFDPLIDFQFLSQEEYALCDAGREYGRFLAAWRQEFVYELLRLGDEVTPFRTLGHIAGVHYIAMTAARGLAGAGVEVDLALISAAAAAHDVGKFGAHGPMSVTVVLR